MSVADNPTNPVPAGQEPKSLKKPKTEAQKAREKARRKRRRQNKAASAMQTAGAEVPLILSEKEERVADIPLPPDEPIVPVSAEGEGVEDSLDLEPALEADPAVFQPVMPPFPEMPNSEEPPSSTEMPLASVQPGLSEPTLAPDATFPPEQPGATDNTGAPESFITTAESSFPEATFLPDIPIPPDYLPPSEQSGNTPLPDSAALFEAGVPPVVSLEPVGPVEVIETALPVKLVEEEPEPIETVEQFQPVEPMSPSAESHAETQPIAEIAGEQPAVPSHEEEEVSAHAEKLRQAEELKQSISDDQGDLLEEAPQSQGLFGKLFDFLVNRVQGKKGVDKVSDKPSPQEELGANDASPENPNDIDEAAPEDEDVIEGETVEDFQGDELESAPELQEIVPEEAGGLIGKIIRVVLGLVVVGGLIIGAFWLGSSLKLMDYWNSFFGPRQAGLELYVGDNSRVVIDADLLRKWGFYTSQLTGRNLGNASDAAYNVFFNANYFGLLKDPMSVTETGISAALYYGFSMESQFFTNKFVFYDNFLAKLRNSNLVRVSDVMDGKVRRDQALDAFIEQTEQLFEEGNGYRREIGTQVDDLTISLNSLAPDKERYETDFFVALEATKGEKANALINQFIEVSKKQVELKAKVAAMAKLYDYYEMELVNMRLRIDAVNKNREALISGVAVTETPGVDLNLIRQ